MKRYTEILLPARKYIPGQGVHPDKDPEGSHIPNIPADTTLFNADTWHNSQRYLYAIDLFNHGYWWETHEVLEKLWVQTGKTTEVAVFIQGLIQISAALLKDSQSQTRGADKLQTKAFPKLHSQSNIYLGINVKKFVGDIENYFSGKILDIPKIFISGDVD